MWLLALLFIVVPMVEITLLVQVAGWIGWLGTIALCVTTGILGASLARREGARTWFGVQQQAAAGRMPQQELIDGALILFAAALLLTPGILTDLIGFLILIPFTRPFIRRGARALLAGRVQVFDGRSGVRRPPQGSGLAPDDVIDADFVVRDGARSDGDPSGER
ncbi:MAG: FxsA family protein [Planctomycetes bacterium]|nr:FxsA family protein [Planctomycetota bacterium]